MAQYSSWVHGVAAEDGGLGHCTSRYAEIDVG